MRTPQRIPAGAPDYYQTLGLQPTATIEQVKAAYRRQALRFHPDKNPGSDAAVERFKACNDAFMVLSKPERRAEYDRTRREGGVQELVGTLVDDLLGTKRPRKQHGRDVRYTMEISFTEAASGLKRRIRFAVLQLCKDCRGSGAAPGGTETCPGCGGKGEIKERPGILSLPQRCPHCGGQGVTIRVPCRACTGVGTLEQGREYEVRLPAGVRDGDVKIVPGQGEPGMHGGRAGELHVVVRVRPDPLFRRHDDDVVVEIPISYCLAATGGSMDVPTLDGQVRMKIPLGTQSGRVFRLRGKGFPRGKLRGDQLVTLVVETPTDLGAEQVHLLEQLEVSCSEDMQPLQREFRRRLLERAGSQNGLLPSLDVRRG